MKILVVGHSNMTNCVRHEMHVANCLKRMGHTVSFFDYRFALAKHDANTASSLIKDCIIANNFDIVFIFSGRGLNFAIISSYKRVNKHPKLVNIYDDFYTDQKMDWFENDCSYCDLSYWSTEDIEYRKLYRTSCNEICQHIISSVDETIYYPLDVEKSIDVLFMGTPHSNRIELITYLLNNNINITIFSQPNMNYTWPHELQKIVHHGSFNISGNIVLNQAKLVLNPNHRTDIYLSLSDRYYITLAVGGVGINQYVKGIETQFENNKHMVWWNSFDECRIQIQTLLQDEKLRNIISNESYSLFCKKYKLSLILSDILKTIEGLS